MSRFPPTRAGMPACIAASLVLALSIAAVPAAQEIVVVRPDVPLPPMPWEGVPQEFQFLFRGGVVSGGLKAAWAGLPFDSISLERTSCYGTCPAYTVTFFRGSSEGNGETYQDRFGRAELRATRVGGADDQYGRRFPDAVGEFTGWIDLWTFGRLSYLIQRSDFALLRDRYPIPPYMVTDAPGSILSVVGRETAKTVVVVADLGPIEVWSIQQAIDSAAKSVNWSRR